MQTPMWGKHFVIQFETFYQKVITVLGNQYEYKGKIGGKKLFLNVSVNIDTFIFIAAMKVHAQDVC